MADKWKASNTNASNRFLVIMVQNQISKSEPLPLTIKIVLCWKDNIKTKENKQKKSVAPVNKSSSTKCFPVVMYVISLIVLLIIYSFTY